MKALLNSFTLAYRCSGILGAFYRIFGTLWELYIRPRLPPSSINLTKLNGKTVPYDNSKLLDEYIGIPNYEWKLICGMKSTIQKGDTVLIVGGGNGVSTLYARDLVGKNGSVFAYEGADRRAQRMKDHFHRRPISNVKINHRVVSKAESLAGSAEGTEILSPKDLPQSDIVVLDCEGAEKSIVPDLSFRPRGMVIETHGIFGAPPADMKNMLTDHEYEINFEKPMNAQNGISIIGAVDKFSESYEKSRGEN